MNTTMIRRPLAVGVAILALGLGVSLGDAHSEHGHPTKIHQGSCDDLGPVAHALTGVGAEVDEAGNPVEAGEAVNADTSYQVLKGTTTLDMTFDALLAEPMAIMVYESDENLEGIACGNIGGLMITGEDGDELAVGLAEIMVPGHTGLALFETSVDAPDQVVVSVYIGHALSPISAGGGMEDGHSDDHMHAEGTPTT